MLSNVELHSFKCFEQLRLPLAPLTLLTGFNASGKSSVLQALALLHQTMNEHEWSTRLMLNGSTVRLGTVGEVSGRRGYKTVIETENHRLSWVFTGERSEMSLAVQEVGIDDNSWNSPGELRYLLPIEHPGRPRVSGLDEDTTALESLTKSLRRLTYITADRMAPKELHPLEDQYQFKTVGSKGENTVSLLYRGREEVFWRGWSCLIFGLYDFSKWKGKCGSCSPGLRWICSQRHGVQTPSIWVCVHQMLWISIVQSIQVSV